MTFTPGDPGHIMAHVTLVTAVNVQAERFGLADDLPLKDLGDEGHLDDHNAIRAKLESIETAAGQAYTTPLPPVRNLGDQDHTTDHNSLVACVTEAATWPAWNAATGGTEATITNYNGSGEEWRVHTFTGSGTLNVSVAVQPFRVLLVAGGGAAKPSVNFAQGGGGAGGMLTDDALSLTSGAHTVTIGAGGTIGTFPQNGENTTAFGLTAIGGGHGAFRDGGQIGPGSGGSGGGESRNNTGPGGAGTPGQGFQGGSGNSANPGGGGGAGGAGNVGTIGPGKASNITGSSVTYARGGGSNGWDASQQYGAGGNFDGLVAQPGVVIVAYRIG